MSTTASNVLPPTTYSSSATGSASGIGGTSGGGAGAGSNTLSLNVGGLDVDYDIGPNTEAFADQAYDYLDNSFNSDAALLGSTIAGSEDFLSGLAAPALSESQTQQQFNTQTLPTMFGTLEAQNQSLGSQAIQAESGVAQASIASSQAEAKQASSGGGGLCWITTAVCETMGWGDQCDELITLRSFRDGYMKETPERSGLVDDYYKLMADILPKVKRDPNRSHYGRTLYYRYVHPAVLAVKAKDYAMALTLYESMVLEVRGRYANA
jgi:hypothetical protein